MELRKVTTDDAHLLWNWANDPLVREMAFNSAKITLKEHKNWFDGKVMNPNCFQYIAFDEETGPLGQIRFDLTKSIADIDYSVDKQFRGKGLGELLMQKGIESFATDIKRPVTLQGRVKKKNIQSVRIFQKAGFQDTRHMDTQKGEPNATHIVFRQTIFPCSSGSDEK